MPWYNGDYPPSYKNQPKYLRDKATEIANEVLTGGDRLIFQLKYETKYKLPKQ